MNFNEIKDLALNYADREDQDVNNKVPFFLSIVESRVNRLIDTQKMTVRTSIALQDEQEYYGLPPDFNGIRDIEIHKVSDPLSRQTLTFLPPGKMNDQAFNTIKGHSYQSTNTQVFYTIIADQIQIFPPQKETVLEMVYYCKVPALTETNNENWLSKNHPDVYTFGLLVEINSYVKDAQAATLWDNRFIQAIQDISINDTDTRWSGPPLQIRNE